MVTVERCVIPTEDTENRSNLLLVDVEVGQEELLQNFLTAFEQRIFREYSLGSLREL